MREPALNGFPLAGCSVSSPRFHAAGAAQPRAVMVDAGGGAGQDSTASGSRPGMDWSVLDTVAERVQNLLTFPRMTISRIRTTALLVLCLAALPAFSQDSPTFLVTRVVDGDTLDASDVGRIRLIGVDTPETVDPRRPVQHFGKEASAFLKRLIEGKRVRLEYDQQRKDAYNRTLAYVYLPDGTFVNAEIVRQGYGFAYTQFPFKYLDEFRRLEREAREAGRGLWRQGTVEQAQGRVGAVVAEESAKLTVYVTRTGEKYHRAGCRFLARSQIPMSLTEAAKRYTPCSVCRPPVQPGR